MFFYSSPYIRSLQAVVHGGIDVTGITATCNTENGLHIQFEFSTATKYLQPYEDGYVIE